MTTTRILGSGVSEGWDGFVRSHPRGTLQHLSPWSVLLQRCFGYVPLPIVAERDGCVVGVLPLFRVRSRLFGDSLSSSPLLVYGGPLAADGEAHAALLDAAATEFRRAGVRSMVLKSRADSPPADGWLARPGLHETYRKPIAGDEAANLAAIPRKQRASVRRGIKAGLSSREGSDVDALFRLFAVSQRDHGTPVLPRSFLRGISDAFGAEAPVTVVERDGVPVAAAMSFLFRDEVNPFYAGFGPRSREVSAPDFLYWEVMRRAASAGVRLFDFGRSKSGTGSGDFKRHWGFEPEPLHYRFMAAPGASVPENNPRNPRFRLLIAGWRRLPLPVANVLGPLVVGGLG